MNCFFFSSTVNAYILKRTQEARGNNIYIPKTFQQSNFTFSVLFEHFIVTQNVSLLSKIIKWGSICLLLEIKKYL